VEWLVAPGDKVEPGAPLANIETDKAVFEVESPVAGTVLEQFFEEGADIPVLTNIMALGEPGEDASTLRPTGVQPDAAPREAAAAPSPAPQTQQAEPSAAPAPAPAASVGVPGKPAAVSPRARKLAIETGVPAESLAGSGPGGRVIERDVRAAAESRAPLTPAAREAVAAGGLHPPSTGSGPGGRTLKADLMPATAAAGEDIVEVPVTGIRKLIADRMHESLATTAQLTLNMGFDATAILSFRRQVKASGESMGLPNITLNDVIVYAAARALRRHPELNAHFLGDKIAQYPRVNMGVATDTPRGLMVPVLHNADCLPLGETSRRIKPIIEACQGGSISPDLLQGGTFTITNMGMLGIESFTPILNAPEVAILGVGRPCLRPVRGEDRVEYVDVINLSLTVNHQAVDGAQGARFLKDLTQSLESFELTLALEAEASVNAPGDQP
jgi:pyruvate dehydrogenase E2 component (dihydrolipoamide acetyltransferase)